MAVVPNIDTTGAYDPQTTAGLQLSPSMPTPIPAVIADGVTYDSGVMYSEGYKALSVGILADHAGTLVITRYIDTAATIAQALSSTAIVASTQLVVNLTDGLPFAMFKVQVVNSAGAVMNVTKFAVLQNAV